MDVQDRKYNGKELDRMHGLDMYDYSARHYDAALGQFTSMDPLCEKYYHISPYAYCAGNPVKYVDPDGNYIAVYDGNTQYRYNAENGQFVDDNGNSYEGKQGDFISTITTLLQNISSGEYGKSFIRDLSEREEGTVIVKSDRCGQIPRDGYKQDSGIQSIIKMNLDQEVEGGTSYTTLAHELAHSQDYLDGTMDNDMWIEVDGNSISKSEIYATHVENLIRAEHPGEATIRQFYSGAKGRVAEFYRDEYRSVYFHSKYDRNPGSIIINRTGYLYKSYR